MEIAGGAHEILHDQFVRIKAIEALARMRVVESIGMLRQLCENVMGWRTPSIRSSHCGRRRHCASGRSSDIPQVRSAYEHTALSGTNL